MKYPPTRNPPISSNRCKGNALIVGMMLLLIMTVAGMAMMQSGSLQERMAGNMNERNVAFQAAESALRDAEQEIRTDVDGPYTPLQEAQFTNPCVNGRCRSAPDAPLWAGFNQAAWNNNANTRAYGSITGAAAIPGVAAQPRYIIEYQRVLGPTGISPGVPCDALFLITAQAVGANANTSVTLQTRYVHRAGSCQPNI